MGFSPDLQAHYHNLLRRSSARQSDDQAIKLDQDVYNFPEDSTSLKPVCSLLTDHAPLDDGSSAVYVVFLTETVQTALGGTELYRRRFPDRPIFFRLSRLGV